MSEKNPTDRERLIDVLAVANGMELPLRVGTKQAIVQIYSREIEALQNAGWEPAGYRSQVEVWKGEFEKARAEVDRLGKVVDALVEEWEPHGFAEHPGRWYAMALFSAAMGEYPKS